MSNNPFQANKADLGSNDIGLSKSEAYEVLQNSFNSMSENICYVCKQPAKHRIVAKLSAFNTAELQKGLYICEHHIRLNILNPEHYALKLIN